MVSREVKDIAIQRVNEQTTKQVRELKNKTQAKLKSQQQKTKPVNESGNKRQSKLVSYENNKAFIKFGSELGNDLMSYGKTDEAIG